MSKIKLALGVVEDLRSLAESIEILVNAVEEPKEEKPVEEVKKQTKKSEEKSPKKEPEKKEKPHTLEEVRAVLASLSQAGKQAQVKSLITSFGAKKLSDIPDTQYPEVLEKASEL